MEPTLRWLCIGAFLLGSALGSGCGHHQPPPWLTSVRVTGHDPRAGIAGLTENPDLPAVGPHLADRFASRRTQWLVRDRIEHPWSRWWQFIPVAPTVLGYHRQTLDLALLEEDATRVEAFFAEYGWRSASVDVSLRRPRFWVARVFRSRERDRTLEAHFEVDVGVRSTLQRLRLYGDPVDLTLPARQFGEGVPWGTETERELLARLQYAAEMGGHGLADVELRQESDADGSTHVEVLVARGPQTVFGPLSFTGQVNLSAASLRRAAGHTVVPGESWNPRRVDLLRRRLQRMPGVDDVVVERDHPLGDTVPIRVTVDEAPRDSILPQNELIGRPGTFTMIFGASWTRRHVLGRNTWTRVHGTAGYRHIWRDVWGGDSGPAGSLGAALETSLEPTATVFLHTSAQAEVDQWHGYHYVRGDGEVGPRIQRGPFSLWVGYRATPFLAFPFERQRDTFARFFETGDRGDGPIERSYLLHQSVVHLELDSIRDPTNPRQGARMTVDAIPFGRVEGSTVQRIAGDVDTYWPTALKLVTLRFRVGAGMLHVSPEEGRPVGVLLGHRMFSGGPSLVRGWVDRGILPPGTVWQPGDPRVGGNVEFHSTFEPRFHVHPHATITPFLDSASVWESPRDVSVHTLRWSAGGGVRFPMVIGEGHLLFAWVVGDPQQDLPNGRMRIHLTVDPY